MMQVKVQDNFSFTDSEVHPSFYTKRRAKNSPMSSIGTLTPTLGALEGSNRELLISFLISFAISYLYEISIPFLSE